MKKKKKGFPRVMFIIAAILAVYLKARDSLNVGSYACGLAVRPCGLGEFVLQILLWAVALFAIMWFITFFIKMIFAPEKGIKNKLMLKKADHQAHKKHVKKKLKKKKAKKKEKVEQIEEEPEVEVLEPEEDLTEQEEESEEKKEIADPWEAIDEHDKEDEVIRI